MTEDCAAGPGACRKPRCLAYAGSREGRSRALLARRQLGAQLRSELVLALTLGLDLRQVFRREELVAGAVAAELARPQPTFLLKRLRQRLVLGLRCLDVGERFLRR